MVDTTQPGMGLSSSGLQNVSQLAPSLTISPNTLTSATPGQQFNTTDVSATQVQPGAPQGSQGGSKLLNTISNFGSATKTGQAINDFGSDAFGLAKSSQVYSSAVGPTQAANSSGFFGSAATSAGPTLTSLLGAAGTGFGIGSLLSGFTGGNPMGSSIGGALGGVAGSLALDGVTTGLGAALGATGIGAEIGSIVPGVGTIVGAVAGSLLGGLFGGGVQHHVSGVNAMGGLGADGTLQGTISGSEALDPSVGQGMANNFQSYLQQQAKTYGINYKNITGVTTVTDPGYYGAQATIGVSADPNFKGNWSPQSSGQTQLFNYDPSNAASQQKAYQNAFNFISTSSGLNPQTMTPTTQASNVVLPVNNTPSDWDNFLANYRKTHG